MDAAPLPFPCDVGAACGGGIAIAIPASRSKTKPPDVIRVLDTGMGLCCSVRQCTLSIQASDANTQERRAPGRRRQPPSAVRSSHARLFLGLQSIKLIHRALGPMD